jgi:hypothetical protein
MVEAILQLKATIHGLTTDEKVKEFNTRLRRSS